MTSPRIPVAVLGATGAVGQKLVSLLAGHPWFRITALVASERNAGRPYGEAVRWLEPAPLPAELAGTPLARAEPGFEGTVAFSALEARAAEAIEPQLAQHGYWVVTNARPYRLDADVPLLIPEVNPEALALLDDQRTKRGWTGAIVANPNCSVIVLASVLLPLDAAFGVEAVSVTTLQAISGAGYPGLPSLDALGNVIPYIPDEEPKIVAETAKLLGRDIPLSVQVTRVPVLDGHTIAVSVQLRGRPKPDAVAAALREFVAPDIVRNLPTAPDHLLCVHTAADRPQPRLDAGRGAGMTVSVGRIRPCPVLGTRFVAMGHNTVRGAAGAALLNAELLVAAGRIPRPA